MEFSALKAQHWKFYCIIINNFFSFTLIDVWWKEFDPVLKIQLILMRIQIRILDLHWNKMDPDTGNFFKIY